MSPLIKEKTRVAGLTLSGATLTLPNGEPGVCFADSTRSRVLNKPPVGARRVRGGGRRSVRSAMNIVLFPSSARKQKHAGGLVPLSHP